MQVAFSSFFPQFLTVQPKKHPSSSKSILRTGVAADSVHFSGSSYTAKSLLAALASHEANQSLVKELHQLKEDEKKEFIKLYTDLNSFPDLKKVSDNIRKHATEVMLEAEKKSGAKIAFSSFSNHCSVGRNLALPGSDIDEWGIVLHGDKGQIDQFKKHLYESYNPLIFNNRSPYDQSKVFSMEEFKAAVKVVEELAKKPEFVAQEKTFLKNLKQYTGDSNNREYVTNTLFNIMLADQLKSEKDKIKIALDISEVMEAYRSGETLIDKLSPQDKKFLQGSALYKYGNFIQTQWKHEPKTKHVARMDIQKTFNEADTDKKIRMIDSMLRASYDDKSGEEFRDYFRNKDNEDDRIGAVVNRIIKGPIIKQA